MPKQWMRSVLLIITYTVLLVLGLMRSDWIFGLLGQILSGCRPLFMGFAIAFILNRPCAFFCRHYERNLGKRWKKLGRPLAVLTCSPLCCPRWWRASGCWPGAWGGILPTSRPC